MFPSWANNAGGPRGPRPNCPRASRAGYIPACGVREVLQWGGALIGGWEICTEKGAPMLGLFMMNRSWPQDQGKKRHSRLSAQHVQCLEL